MLPAGRSRRGQRADAFRRATPLMSDPFSARTTVRTTTCRAVSSPRSVARELALDEDLTRWRKSFLQRFAIHQFIQFVIGRCPPGIGKWIDRHFDRDAVQQIGIPLVQVLIVMLLYHRR